MDAEYSKDFERIQRILTKKGESSLTQESSSKQPAGAAYGKRGSRTNLTLDCSVSPSTTSTRSLSRSGWRQSHRRGNCSPHQLVPGAEAHTFVHVHTRLLATGALGCPETGHGLTERSGRQLGTSLMHCSHSHICTHAQAFIELRHTQLYTYILGYLPPGLWGDQKLDTCLPGRRGNRRPHSCSGCAHTFFYTCTSIHTVGTRTFVHTRQCPSQAFSLTFDCLS